MVGGREAAQKLNEYIKEQVQTEHEKLHVWIFVNLRGLNVTLRKCGFEEAADGLDSFVWGFNQAAERFAMIDVGSGKEAVDAKVKGTFATVCPSPTYELCLAAYLEDEVKSLETAKVIAGGRADCGHPSCVRLDVSQSAMIMDIYTQFAQS